jgi:hypothetical protein
MEGKESMAAEEEWNDLSIAEMIDGREFSNLRL